MIFNLGISKSTWWNVWYESTCITDTFIKLSWALDKVDENEFNLIGKYVCAAYDPHIHFRTSRQALIPFVYFVTFHILRSAYAAGKIWGVKLQPSDQIPSPVDWGWKNFKGKMAVD